MGKRKLTQLSDSEDDEKTPRESERSEGGSDDDQGMEAKPIGEPVKRVGRGRVEKRFYQAFELDGHRYELEDPVLVTPEEKNQKPYVAIIKEIKQNRDGSMFVTGQWFYRPEEAEKKGGGSWAAQDARELFYSFHRDEVAAESVMHKCVVHFIPLHKQAPLRSRHPGFIVRRVYDTVERKLWKLTDKDYEDSKQMEIDLLIQKTRDALGELPDMEIEEVSGDQEDPEKNKRQIRKRIVTPLSLHREETPSNEMPGRDGFGRPDTPGSCLSTETQGGSEASAILQNCNAVTGVKSRDRWLEKILQGVKNVFIVDSQQEGAGKLIEDAHMNDSRTSASEDEAQQRPDEASEPRSNGTGNKISENTKVDEHLLWPEAAVAAVTALERAAYESLGIDVHKYNIKMRQLEFNLKNNTFLARRLLKKELEPLKVLSMSPAELKDGFTAEEKSAQEPEEPETMQMADVRCTICSEKKVGVKDIIHVGYGDRYQLECLKCGYSWYSSRDSISSLTIETVNPRLTVGTAPWATSKFEEVEKELASPREPEKSGLQESSQEPNSEQRLATTSEQLQEGSHTLSGQVSLPMHTGGGIQPNVDINDGTEAEKLGAGVQDDVEIL
eukprot:c25658_g1_i1 orf=126-1961(+)